ncbi:MAG: GNAT family N-acetyltransferase [Cyanobacteria bacterium]|nr:GNAT family N-acetyltransferase [Cyanobacteriota bacterium]
MPRGEALSSLQDGVWTVNPLVDVRWPDLTGRHSNASVFHSRGWLNTLRTTYGYEPLAFTTSAPSEELTNALLFCVVRSWLTGSRLVSLPFSDHCDPLVENDEQFQALCAHAEAVGVKERWNYVEMRTGNPSLGVADGFRQYRVYQRHRLNLRPSLEALQKGFHKDCIRRRIRHAECQGLGYEEGRSELLIRHLYALIVRTRLRKHLPPQPFEWFQNLIACMGKDVCIRVAFKGNQPIAGIVTLDHGKKMYYKYGASDAEFNNLGAMPLLLWKAIKAAKTAGMEELDLGRSDLDNRGLIRFKERWSAEGVPLSMWRAPASAVSPSCERLKLRLAKTVCAYSPSRVLILAGRLLYRHIG